MNSVWLNKHMESVNEIHKKKNGGNKTILLLAFMIVFFGIVIFAVTTSPNQSPEDKATPAILTAIYLPIMGAMLLLRKKTANRDVTKNLRENLETLLTTQEQVEEFDREMSAEPLTKLVTGGYSGKEFLFLTEHFMGLSTIDAINLQDYRFVRLSDIKEMRFAVSRDQTKAFGMGIQYIIDLLDANGKKCMGFSILGKERMGEFERMLKKYCPEIKLQEHKMF